MEHKINEMLQPFYNKIELIEKDSCFPIEVLHVDLVIESFVKTVKNDFEKHYREQSIDKIIEELLIIKDKFLGNTIVCQLLGMMDTWENVDKLYGHEVLGSYY